MRLRQKRYRLNTADICKAYKVALRKTPPLPLFEEKEKVVMETDDEMEKGASLHA